ncbi:hypothetical protein OSB04_003728 [Centaurea solstitialis]|uniref:Uncharacterized protein n=1 Tax=Centaurea solstitialis TaxID=347529 RepID=A0AA38UCI7_9ASTR|nr:hypothetical protein OSB04_003728 [Centaurea solstitialis]
MVARNECNVRINGLPSILKPTFEDRRLKHKNDYLIDKSSLIWFKKAKKSKLVDESQKRLIIICKDIIIIVFNHEETLGYNTTEAAVAGCCNITKKRLVKTSNEMRTWECTILPLFIPSVNLHHAKLPTIINNQQIVPKFIIKIPLIVHTFQMKGYKDPQANRRLLSRSVCKDKLGYFNNMHLPRASITQQRFSIITKSRHKDFGYNIKSLKEKYGWVAAKLSFLKLQITKKKMKIKMKMMLVLVVVLVYAINVHTVDARFSNFCKTHCGKAGDLVDKGGRVLEKIKSTPPPSVSTPALRAAYCSKYCARPNSRNADCIRVCGRLSLSLSTRIITYNPMSTIIVILQPSKQLLSCSALKKRRAFVPESVSKNLRGFVENCKPVECLMRERELSQVWEDGVFRSAGSFFFCSGLNQTGCQGKEVRGHGDKNDQRMS